jgi:hypothetical protein
MPQGPMVNLPPPCVRPACQPWSPHAPPPSPSPLPGVHHHDEELVGDWLDEMEQSSLAVDPSPAADEVVREAVEMS